MQSSPRDTAVSPAKRRREMPQRTRSRKKRKRLDAICDEPTASYLADRKLADDEVNFLRRSSRARRPPDLLDSSPVPSTRMNNLNEPHTPGGRGGGKKGKWKGDDKEEARGSNGLKKGESVAQMNRLLGEEGKWKSRLRTRVGKCREDSSSSFRKSDEGLRELRPWFPVMGDKTIGGGTLSSRSSSRSKKIYTHDVSETATETGNKDEILSLVKINCNNGLLAEKSSQVDVAGVASIEQLESEPARMLDRLEKVVGVTEEIGFVNESFQVGETHHTIVEESGLLQSRAVEEHGSEDHEPNQPEKHLESPDTNTVLKKGVLKDNIQKPELSLKDNGHRVSVSNEKIAGFRIKEGRRCGLCGCGTDGKPPKKLVHESFDSENEAYGGSTASDEPNYNVWDGFGGEPGWLGRLLGPMNDRFSIARVWVHQHCAVWSPEVYFANLGCLKNVRAALCRGRALKCSRCGRPGATIGCRVDRCPKTYHLPCSRIEGCIFDHRKFLIACSEHRRYFQPHGNNHTLQVRKMKAKKMRLDMRKGANEAGRKDLEAEEKWLENCGEDEEFLKREGRRLHRDILRIAPIYIGGSSENEHLFQGWESVAGLEHVIQCMKEVVLLPLLYPEFFTNLCLTPPRGVLLHGYPGTGKTHVVRALIGACSRGDKKIAYFARKGADCLGKYVGDAERQLRLLFQVAERFQPSIIFFDEIDGLAPIRSRQQDQTHSSVVSTLLSLLDGLKSRGSVIVIGATNRPDAVDPALRRPGRFDREIYFPLPSENDRSSILSLHTRSWPKPLSGSLLSWIANQTVGYAGADLQALCAQAAMHALKRNCALQQLLSSVAKGTIQGKLPCLPSFKVEERDWLAALALAPPPCSQREAGIAVNDIVSSPLPVHLIPCFMVPLSHLLVSLYIDDRIWLAPMLFKASKSVKKVIVSALQQKGLPVSFWWSHLHYLVLDPFIAKQIENKFAHFGLVVGSSGSGYSIMLDGVDDESDENEKFDSFGIELSGTKMHKKLSQNCPLLVGKAIGFRTLIYGAPRSGQQHLASCLLQGFMGHEEIRKVSLATISQEGHGDMIYGLTQILLKCLDVGRCIIYMPRIDLWALEENACTNTGEKPTNSEKFQFMAEKVTAGSKGVSEMWNSFVEQIDSSVTSASLTILATCELEKGSLPHGLIRFFSSDVCSDSNTESTIPRFFLHIDGKLDLELVINSAAKQLSYDLVQHYLKLMHERTHVRHSGDMNKDLLVDVSPQEQVQDAISNKISIELEQIATNGGTSCVNDPNFQGTNITPLPPHTSGARIAPSQPYYGIQDSFSRSGKFLKGNLSLAIATFGYQILNYPQFAELIWVTSKLREGPCTDISGPWKRWPFNTCVMHAECPSEKGVFDMVSPGVVRGLIAVGLLAYRGLYTSVSEVSADVRKVLELLVGQIRAKLFGRKDSYCNFRVLSQVAYLDDMVNSWGYMLQSLQSDNNLAEVNTKPVVLGRLQSETANTGGTDIADNQLSIRIHAKSRNIAPDISPQSFSANDGEFALVQPSIASKEPTNGGEPSASELSLADPRFNNTIDQIPDLTVSEDTNMVEVSICSNDCHLPGTSTSDLSKVSCLYNCCSNCAHTVTALSLKMISGYFRSDGCYSLDDAHDIITACSLNILTSFKKYCVSESIADLEESRRRNLCHCGVSEKIEELLPSDCHCHARKEDAASPFESKLTYFFRDSVLVPPLPYKDSELHCNFVKLCVCPVVRALLTIEQTLVQ